jgi:ubiquinone/menaquinone biosynthesis C-methylase UbiE
MALSLRPERRARSKTRKSRKHNPLHRLIEHDLIRRVSYREYRDKVQRVYDGPKGAVLAACSMVSLHIPLGKRLFRTRKFDLRGARRVLDVGSGAGQLAGHVLRYCDPGTQLVCTDLSHRMLQRARTRLANQGRQQRTPTGVSTFLAADLSQLPFADGAFDTITCGYVLEHLPDPEPGLAEMARVLQPGGRMLLLTTEDSFSGAWTSRLWYCRTYNRQELRQT